MKPIMKYIYTLPMMMLLWLAFGMLSCIREEFPGEAGQKNYNAVTINVQMPEMIVKNPMETRAGASDFNKMTDINIVIAGGEDDKERIRKIIFFNFDEVKDGEKIDGMEVYYKDQVTAADEAIRSFTLLFTKEWLKENSIPANTGGFFVVGNLGEKLPETIKTIGDLKRYPVPSNNGIIATNVMFGEKEGGERQSEHTHPDGTKDICRQLNIELKRLTAMVTLRIDATRLSNKIAITPQTIALHNVPATCTLGPYNRVTTGTLEENPQETDVKPDAVVPDGEFKDGMSFTGGITLVGTDPNDGLVWDMFRARPNHSSIAGNHYKDDGSELVYPLFLFENHHGPDFGAKDVDKEHQYYKRPAALGEFRDSTSIDNATGSCSYLEVTANYIEYNEDGMGVSQRGTAKWRFFLGDNVTDNFDVLRNTNYQVDLILEGSAIGEKGYSWRVGASLKPPAIVGEVNMVVGGGGEMFCVEPVGNNNNLKFTSKNADFVYVYTKKNGDMGWHKVSDFGYGATQDDGETNGQTWFYVSPLLPETVTDPEDLTERSCSIDFLGTDKTVLETVTFTQYRPIKVEIGWDDIFTKENTGYPCDDKPGVYYLCGDIHEVENLIETYYNYKFTEGGAPFYFYVDRVDRTPMPWGFDGVILDKNQTSGFENVYHLIDPKEPLGTHCNDHTLHAIHYLPTGKGWQEKPGGYIDYSRGSCMMHAAMENYFQKYFPKPEDNVTPMQMVLTNTLPERPEADKDYSYGWCVPSISGWQLLEKYDRHLREHVVPKEEGIFKEEHPILPYTFYWTSNTESSDITKYDEDNDGTTRSFAYEFYQGLDKMSENDNYPGYLLMPRTTPLRYRLLNINPGFLKDDSSVPGPSTRMK